MEVHQPGNSRNLSIDKNIETKTRTRLGDDLLIKQQT